MIYRDIITQTIFRRLRGLLICSIRIHPMTKDMSMYSLVTRQVEVQATDRTNNASDDQRQDQSL